MVYTTYGPRHGQCGHRHAALHDARRCLYDHQDIIHPGSWHEPGPFSDRFIVGIGKHDVLLYLDDTGVVIGGVVIQGTHGVLVYYSGDVPLEEPRRALQACF